MSARMSRYAYLAWTITLGSVVALWTLPSFQLPVPADYRTFGLRILYGIGATICGVFCISVRSRLLPTAPRMMSLAVATAVLVAWCVLFLPPTLSGELLFFTAIPLPSPAVSSALFGLALVGAMLLLAHGLFMNRAGNRVYPSVSLIVGVGTSAALGLFAYDIVLGGERELSLGPQQNFHTSPVNRLRLFNLNVSHRYDTFDDHEERFATTARILRHFQADIIVLQEVWTTSANGSMVNRLREKERITCNYAYAKANGSPRIGFEEGIAIMSHFPILKAERVLLMPRRSLWESHIALIAQLDLGAGETLTVVGVNLSDSNADEQAEYLRDIMKSCTPDIVAGNFNARRQSHAIKGVQSQGFTEAIPDVSILGHRHLNANIASNGEKDYVFIGQRLQESMQTTNKYRVLTSRAVTHDQIHRRIAVSKHDAIVVDFERRQAPIRHRR